MTAKPNDVRVSRELLKSALGAVEYLALRGDDIGTSNVPVADELRALLAKPADHQCEPVAWEMVALGKNGEGPYRRNASTVKPTPRDAIFCWGEGVVNRFEIMIWPLYRHAQPATAKVDQALSDFLNSIAVDGLPDYLGPDQLDGSDPLNHANPYDWFRWNGEFRPIGKYELCDVVLRSGEILSAIDPHEVEWDDGSVVAARYTPAAKLNGGQS